MYRRMIEFRCKSNIIEEVLAFYGKYGKVLFCVREDPGDNPHYHGLLETSHKKKYLADSKNSKTRHPELDEDHYKNQHNWKMNDVKDYDAYLRYMCKGELAKSNGKRGKEKRYFLKTRSEVFVKVNEIISQDDIRLKQDEFWELYGIEEELSVSSSVGVKIKTPTFNEIIMREFELPIDQGGFDHTRIYSIKDESYKDEAYYRIAREIRCWLMQKYTCLKKDFDCNILGRKVNLLMSEYGGRAFREWVRDNNNCAFEHRF